MPFPWGYFSSFEPKQTPPFIQTKEAFMDKASPSTSRDGFLAAILCDRDPAGTAAFVAEVLYEYSPDEPRDDRGRWTTGGSAIAADAESPSEADHVKTLKDCAAGWRKDGYEVAATFLDYFLNHKNGKPTDVCDASKLPPKSRENIESSSKVVDAVLMGLTSEAQAKVKAEGAVKTSFNVAKKLGHVDSDPSDGEIFWAFGGFDLSVNGRLTVDGWNNRWYFSGSVRIDDTYAFPATAIRMLFPSYAAANALEAKYKYKRFVTKLEWQVDAEGSSSSVPGSPRVKYRPK